VACFCEAGYGVMGLVDSSCYGQAEAIWILVWEEDADIDYCGRGISGSNISMKERIKYIHLRTNAEIVD